MKNRYYIFGCLAALMGLMGCLYSCTDELEGIGGISTRPTDVICFTASLSDNRSASVSRSASGCLEMEQEEWLVGVDAEQGVSRGTPVSLLSGSAGVIGYAYDTWGANIKPWFGLYNKQFNFDGDELTAASNDVRWNTMVKTASGYVGNVSFYLYAPYNLTGGTLSDQNTGGVPTLTYTVNDDVASQDDLIVASWQGSEGTNYGIDTQTQKVIQPQSIPLSFEHVLTGVKFKVGFECIVTKLEVKGIRKTGTYNFSSGWTSSTPATTKDYEFIFQKKNGGDSTFLANSPLTQAENTLLMIPQTFPADPDSEAKIVLTYKKSDGVTQTKSYPLAGKVWQPGKMVTYTLHENPAVTPIYFDLAAGNVLICCTEASDGTPTATDRYIGYVFKDGGKTIVDGEHKASNIYYVYQTTGNPSTSTLPNYTPITYDGKSWVDFITNNTSVAGVINAWKSAAQEVGRTATTNRIRVYGSGKVVNLTIDNIYSTYAERAVSRTKAGIGFNAGSNSKLTITTVGDNRVSAIHYHGGIDKNNNLIFEGTGSLTVGAASGDTKFYNDTYVGETVRGDTTFIDNHWCSAIGGNDSGEGNSCGIIINSGNIFAGTTKAENCTAIGAGGNDKGIITINGGTITAVATTTGTAIGGGIGFKAAGGVGNVTINGGNVYAYNHKNRWSIPSSAIGGAGSSESSGTIGYVTINGGYVYAYSAFGTAIGGGSSATNVGGKADVTITGGQVIAKSADGAGIGGGSAYTNATANNTATFDGGTAKIKISGEPIIRTGSIGGGSTGAKKGQIGSADIEISGGDIQAQFVMAAGADVKPKFTMTDGTIRNSYTDDEEYKHTKDQGGAVYLEDGTFTMKGGVIKNCSAEQGGAVYIAGSNTTTFTMEGGEIHSCFATGKKDENGVVLERGHGGAVCLNGGKVQMSGGRIWNNYSENGNGGAIYINNGNFSMNDTAEKGLPQIDGNSAQKGDGGGVFVSSAGSAVEVDLLQGIITNNTANNYGGGVCVDMGNTDHAATVIAGVTGEGATEATAKLKIHDNASMMAGGGLYVRGVNANITINSGMIDKNKVSAYVRNPDVTNEKGKVTLNEGQVTHVVVTFMANGNNEFPVKVDDVVVESDSQKIVTNTNSKLKPCRFKRGAYNFVKWNTRSDGKGKDYDDEALMNISENITLYAIWKFQGS